MHHRCRLSLPSPPPPPPPPVCPFRVPLFSALLLRYETVDAIRKEGNVLFNVALNTFYLRLYGVGHMVKDHSVSEKEKPIQLDIDETAAATKWANLYD